MKSPSTSSVITNSRPTCRGQERRFYAVCIGLALAVLTVYWPVYDHDFITLDDAVYVTGNPHVRSGLTIDNLRWAFSSIREAYWHPLALISHMVDCSLFGLNAGGHLGVSLLLHIANAILLFILLRRTTGVLWPSAFAAALFALHPINVESVAWVASRKTVLSAFFGLGSLLAYVNYTTNARRSAYLAALLLFLLALLTKPTAIVLPGIMLLLDFWPQRRFMLQPNGKEAQCRRLFQQGITQAAKPILLEKFPFFMLACGLVLVSMLSADHKNILLPGELIPLGLRLANAVVTYLIYPLKMLAPSGLTVFYPFPDVVALWKVLGAGFALFGITTLVLLYSRRAPYLVTGWFWYAGALIPTIGIVQAGTWPAWADRWAYVPLIGLLILIAWGAAAFYRIRPRYRIPIVGAALAFLVVLAVLTRVQVGHWKNSETLFSHTLAYTQENFLAHGNLGLAYARQGKFVKAVAQFYQALQKVPQSHPYRNNLSAAMAKGLDDLASQRIVLGRLDEAVALYRESLKYNPNSPETLGNYGLALLRQGKPEKALALFDEALRIEPGFDDAKRNRALCRTVLDRIENAAAAFEKDLQRASGHAGTVQWLRSVNRSKRQLQKAIGSLARALALQPGFRPDAFEPENLLKVQAVSLLYEETESVFLQLYRSGIDTGSAAYHLACIKSRQNDAEAALTWLKNAVRNGFSDWNRVRNEPDFRILRQSPAFEKIVPKI